MSNLRKNIWGNICWGLSMMDKKTRENSIVFISGTAVILFASLIFAVSLIFLLSSNPLEAIKYFFIGPFLNTYSLGNMIDAAVPLIFSGLGIAVAFKASLFNLGGEGQIYTGAVITTVICLILPNLGSVGGPVTGLLAGGVAAGLLAALSGYLKVKWNVDNMISSFLLSGVIIYIVDYLITGVFDDPSSSLLATPYINSRYFLLPVLEPSTLSISIYFALFAALFIYILLYRTRWGYELNMCGLNREFARYGGINVSSYVTIPLFLSGMLHGLGGGLAVLGTYHLSIKGFTSGIGWNGIAVALLAKNNPLGVIPAALFFTYVNAGAKAAMLNSDVSYELAAVVEAFVFFFITARLIFRVIRKRRAMR